MTNSYRDAILDVDLTVGYGGKLSENWSYDLHLAYYDVTNPRLLDGTNGDLVNPGATLRYNFTKTTNVYANTERYDGIGSRGFPGGWRHGVGLQAVVGALSTDSTFFYNQNFLGHGHFLRFRVTTAAPIAKFAGREVRPALEFYQPIGGYRRDFDSHVIGAIKITF